MSLPIRLLTGRPLHTDVGTLLSAGSLFVGFLLLALSFGILTSVPCAAQSISSAQLTGLARTSSATPSAGQDIVLTLRTDAEGSSATTILATYLDPSGGMFNLLDTAPPFEAISAATSSTMYGGKYELSMITVVSTAASATYHRDGTVEHNPANASGPTTHLFDFATLDFHLMGATVPKAPVLESISRTSPSVADEGETVQLALSIHLQGDTTSLVNAVYLDPANGYYPFVSTAPPFDSLSRTVSAGTAGGSYRLSRVVITTAAGVTSTYHRDGTITNWPTGSVGPTTHSLNFEAVDFTVSGAVDVHAPVLNSITRTSSATLGVNDSLNLEVSADAGGNTLNWIVATYEDPNGDPLSISTFAEPFVSLYGSLANHLTSGQYKLSSVMIYTTELRTAIYHRDGRIDKWPPGAIGASTHSPQLLAC